MKELLKKLGVSTWELIWAYVFGDGIWGVAEIGCKAFTKQLQKISPDQMHYYAGIVMKIAQCLRYDIGVICEDKEQQEAGYATVDLIEKVAIHLEDGEYTRQELQEDVANVQIAISEWKDLTKKCGEIGEGQEKSND